MSNLEPLMTEAEAAQYKEEIKAFAGPEPIRTLKNAATPDNGIDIDKQIVAYLCKRIIKVY